jgi:hypothetical protein
MKTGEEDKAIATDKGAAEKIRFKRMGYTFISDYIVIIKYNLFALFAPLTGTSSCFYCKSFSYVGKRTKNQHLLNTGAILFNRR